MDPLFSSSGRRGKGRLHDCDLRWFWRIGIYECQSGSVLDWRNVPRKSAI